MKLTNRLLLAPLLLSALASAQAHAAAGTEDLMVVWSSAGAVDGLTCTQWYEAADPHTWDDNYLCTDVDLGLQWSSAGAISGMTCTQILEAADPHTWSDNYLCAPEDSAFTFAWNSAGPIDGMACVQIYEAADAHTWDDNYLCWEAAGTVGQCESSSTRDAGTALIDDFVLYSHGECGTNELVDLYTEESVIHPADVLTLTPAELSAVNTLSAQNPDDVLYESDILTLVPDIEGQSYDLAVLMAALQMERVSTLDAQLTEQASLIQERNSYLAALRAERTLLQGYRLEAPTSAPVSELDLRWSSAGAISGMTCTQWYEAADPHTWDDNYLCNDVDVGLQWSSAGAISGMTCTQILEAADPHTWSDNYLCAPEDSAFTFAWNSAGPIDGMTCTQILEAADPHTWSDNYLCWEESGGACAATLISEGPMYTVTSTESCGGWIEVVDRTTGESWSHPTQADLDDIIDLIDANITAQDDARQLDSVRLQSIMSQRNQAFNLLTAVIAKHDATKDSIISNLR